MKTLTPKQLEIDLKNHALRLADPTKGAWIDWSGCNLRDANLRYADLRYANLRDADLSDANLRYADLRYANLRDADLSDADLRYANLRYAKNKSAHGFVWTHVCTMAHLDGSMRQLALYANAETAECRVEAGCFFGTPKVFAEKAASEGKMIYATVVPATCEAWLKALTAEKP